MSGTKIAFTGPECSGKSTMACWLAKELSFDLVKEYAREYLKDKSSYSMDDLDIIASKQFERNSVKGALVIDTEMLVMKIWYEEKYQRVSENILQLLERQQIDLYFLCKPDFKWVPDPLRENPQDRDRLFHIYEASLKKCGFSYCVLSGSEAERKKIIKATLANKDIL